MRFFLSLSLFLILQSCSWTESRIKNTQLPDDYKIYNDLDYKDHLVQIGTDFLKSNKKKMVKLSGTSVDYLKRLVERLVINNRILLGEINSVSIHLLKFEESFHFSAPDGHIIISTGMLKKYINFEGLLATILAYGLVRNSKLVYSKNLTVPIGAVTFRDFEIYHNLDFKTQNILNKWTFYVLKRSGLNPVSVLRLLQIKNKNFLDFATSNETYSKIAREETAMKTFLVKNKLYDDSEKVSQNSSRGFYTFRREVLKL